MPPNANTGHTGRRGSTGGRRLRPGAERSDQDTPDYTGLLEKLQTASAPGTA